MRKIFCFFSNLHNSVLECEIVTWSNLYYGGSTVTYLFIDRRCKYTSSCMSISSNHATRDYAINKSHPYRNVNAFTSTFLRSETVDLEPARVSRHITRRMKCDLRTLYVFEGKMFCAKNTEVVDSKRKITIWPQWLAALTSKSPSSN